MHPAPRVAAVGEDHHRPAPSLACADALGGLRNRIVQRRRAERHERRHRLGQRSEIACEWLHFVEPCIEGEDGRLVAAVEPAEKMRGGFAGAGKVAFHAAADVKEQRHADARRVGTKIGDGSRPAGIEDLKITRREVAHEPAFVIAYDGRYANDIDARLERGHRWLLREQFTCQTENHTSHDSRDPLGLCHADRLVQINCHVAKVLEIGHLIQFTHLWTPHLGPQNG